MIQALTWTFQQLIRESRRFLAAVVAKKNSFTEDQRDTLSDLVNQQKVIVEVGFLLLCFVLYFSKAAQLIFTTAIPQRGQCVRSASSGHSGAVVGGLPRGHQRRCRSARELLMG